MLGVKDKGILLQIIKRCNRVIEKVSNISDFYIPTKSCIMKHFVVMTHFLKSVGLLKRRSIFNSYRVF